MRYRSQGSGCPYCGHKRVAPETSLRTLAPLLAREWHPTKNGRLTPDDVMPGSDKKVWWRCHNEPRHVWQRQVFKRKQNSACPECARSRSHLERSLAHKFPRLAREFHPTRNGALTPEQVPARSRRPIWWKCPKGADHEWRVQVTTRLLHPRCPFCSRERPSRSHSLARKHPRLVREWHPTKNGTLTPRDILPSSNKLYWWKCPRARDHEWQARPSDRARAPGCPFCKGHRITRSNSLLTLQPKLAREWHPTKNGALTPLDVGPRSKVRVFWKCDQGPDHEWQTAVYKRTCRKDISRCPFCVNRRVSVTNSLARLRPELAREWHPTMNGKLRPSGVNAFTQRVVWWRCRVEPRHEWQARVDVRTKGRGCPRCRPRVALGRVPAELALSVVNPALAREWHPKKNRLSPGDVHGASRFRAWWKCPAGPDHEWQVPVFSRHHGKTGCPCCANKKLSVTNRLDRRFPEVARQWHPKKNGKLRASSVVFGSHLHVWWKCVRGPDHEWRAQIISRTRGGARCPYCYGKLASSTNNLALHHPRLARTWHPRKNGKLKASDVRPASAAVVWWKCPRGPDHQWQESVESRVSSRRCPFCAGSKVSVTNSLKKLFPTIARQWHPKRNGGLDTADVLATATQPVWWRCPLGHDWRAPVRERTLSRLGCPICAHK